MSVRQRRNYSKEFKKEAVELVTVQGYSISEAASSLGVHTNVLGRWRREYLARPQDAFPGRGHQSAEVDELKRLREENRRLKMEKEILKKAAAFFARESD